MHQARLLKIFDCIAKQIVLYLQRSCRNRPPTNVTKRAETVICRLKNSLYSMNNSSVDRTPD